MKTETIDGKVWVVDENNNRASVDRWGSVEEAEASLRTLARCYRCSDCSDCSDCSGCYRCYDCSGCSGCSDCYDCSGCYRCSDKKGEKTELVITVPKIENIHAAVLAAASGKGALDMGNWHTCDTTHCRAGWVVHLAGEAGYALEAFYGGSTLMAAMQIYNASSPHRVSPPRFFESNEKAMKDMERMAALESDHA